jgi:hypothetical protein
VTYLGVGVVQQLLEVGDGEVGNTNVLHLAGVEKLLHLPPGVNEGPVLVNCLPVISIHGSGPVHEVKV